MRDCTVCNRVALRLCRARRRDEISTRVYSSLDCSSCSFFFLFFFFFTCVLVQWRLSPINRPVYNRGCAPHARDTGHIKYNVRMYVCTMNVYTYNNTCNKKRSPFDRNDCRAVALHRTFLHLPRSQEMMNARLTGTASRADLLGSVISVRIQRVYVYIYIYVCTR